MPTKLSQISKRYNNIVALTTTNYSISPFRKKESAPDTSFVPGFSSIDHHERIQASQRESNQQNSSSPPPPPPPPPPFTPPLPNNTAPNTAPTSTSSTSYSTSQYPGEEELYPDYNEATFNPDVDKLPSNNATASGSIRAFYLSRQIDVLKIFQKQYGRESATNTQMPIINKNSVILVIPSHTRGLSYHDPTHGTAAPGTLSPSPPTTIVTPTGGLADPDNDTGVGYAVFLDFGAAIFFGLDEAEESKILASAEEFCTDRVTGTLRQENMMYEEVPTLDKWHKYDRTSDTITLQKIDLNTVRVVAGVIGQTVALDHYEREADALLDVFQELNKTIAKSQGNNMGVSKGKLFQLVAENNTIITSAITKLGLLDHARPGEAMWNVEVYYKVWNSLREEFELETRFQNLSTKLDFIADNLKFFADQMENKKSHRLEIYIIILIAAELGVSLYEHPELYEFLFFWRVWERGERGWRAWVPVVKRARYW